MVGFFDECGGVTLIGGIFWQWILAKGRVQRVGYRDEVEEIARRLEITGFVENVKPYDVRIIAEMRSV